MVIPRNRLVCLHQISNILLAMEVGQSPITKPTLLGKASITLVIRCIELFCAKFWL